LILKPLFFTLSPGGITLSVRVIETTEVMSLKIA